MELFKDVNYEYQSSMSDVGTYRGRYRFYRWTMNLEIQADSNYSAITGGITSPRSYNDQLLYASANLSARVKPIDQFGKLVDDPKWIGEIVDPAIIMDLYLKLVQYDNSFRVTKEGTVDEGTST